MGVPNQQIGIYKVTSPSGKVYVGQSWDIQGRIRKYRSLTSVKKQRILYNSIAKYGWINHKFEIIELLDNPSQALLDEKEIFYIDLFKKQGYKLLNIKEGGLGGKLPKESIEKMLMTRGKWNHTKESKNKISINHFGLLHTEETKDKMKKNKNSCKTIIHLDTGTFYFGVNSAADTFGMNAATLVKKLNGSYKNNTNLIYI